MSNNPLWYMASHGHTTSCGYVFDHFVSMPAFQSWNTWTFLALRSGPGTRIGTPETEPKNLKTANGEIYIFWLVNWRLHIRKYTQNIHFKTHDYQWWFACGTITASDRAEWDFCFVRFLASPLERFRTVLKAEKQGKAKRRKGCMWDSSSVF